MINKYIFIAKEQFYLLICILYIYKKYYKVKKTQLHIYEINYTSYFELMSS